MLLKNERRVVRASLVRHPLDQWISLKEYGVSGSYRLTDYLYGYRKFAEMSAEIGFVRYEDFTCNQDETLKNLFSIA